MSRSYADDGHIYSSCLPEDIDALREQFESCMMAVMKRVDENSPTLNPAKTKLLWLCTPRCHINTNLQGGAVCSCL